MMNSPHLISFCLIAVVCGTNANASLEDPYADDYYWQNYEGTVPDGALPGGNDKEGRPTYIGQTFHNHGRILVPGEINPINKTLVYEMYQEQQITSADIKILCARTPDAYEWVNTNATQVRFLVNKRHVITGGNNKEFPYIIGRIKCEKRIIVGKVNIYDRRNVFTFIKGEGTKCVDPNFQVLSYTLVIDVRMNK